MANEKKKLFTEEDFRKEEEQSHLSKYGKYSGGALIAFALIAAGLWYLWPKENIPSQDPVPVVPFTAAAVDSMKVDTASVASVEPQEEQVQQEGQMQQQEPQGEAAKVDNTAPSTTSSAETTAPAAPVTTARGETLEVDAKKAIRGDFGNGLQRKQVLGNDYAKVQAIVNQKYREGKLHW